MHSDNQEVIEITVGIDDPVPRVRAGDPVDSRNPEPCALQQFYTSDFHNRFPSFIGALDGAQVQLTGEPGRLTA